jgi:hypothetical protein
MKRKLSTDDKMVALCQQIMNRLASDTLKSCRAGTIAPKEILEVIDALERYQAQHQALMKRRHPEPESGAAIEAVRKRLGKTRAPSTPAERR